MSVNVGRARPIAGKAGQSGIFKQPLDGPVAITRLGLEGDAVCDATHHGGVDQAVYLYSTLDYAWWAEQLGCDLQPGTFGENLTVAHLDTAPIRIGDLLRAGTTTLQITAPRIPCATLATRMGDPSFVRRFRHAERPGLYCRVLQEGHVQAGDLVSLEPYEGETVSALELFRAHYRARLGEQELRRHLAAPIAVRDRADKEQKLQKIVAGH